MTVVKEGETLEKELRAHSQRRGSRFFDVGGEAMGSGLLKGRHMSVLGWMMEEGESRRVIFP